MNADRRVAAVMWTYGRSDVAEQCVRALLAQTHPLEQIIVVDSASPDDTAERLRATFGDRITVLELADNLGPGAAIAAGVRALGAGRPDDVWLVEDDSRPADGLPGPARRDRRQPSRASDGRPRRGRTSATGSGGRSPDFRRERRRRSTSCTSTAPCSAPRSCTGSTVPAATTS